MFNKRWQRLWLGLLFSSGVGLFAFRRRSLSRSGVLGAMATGSVTVGMGGWAWGLSLIYFFTSSSLLSHFRGAEKERTAADKFSKGSQRDILQVFANGGVATALSLAYGLTHSQRVQELLQAGYTGALATANGDTWATELGVLTTHQPRLITTGKPVAPGTSGGITLLGTAASAAGGFSLGLVFWVLETLARQIHLPRRRGLLSAGLASKSRFTAPTAALSPRQTHLPRRRGRFTAPTAALSASNTVTDEESAKSREANKLAVDALNLSLQGLISGLTGSLADSLLGATLQAMYFCPTCQKETERRIHRCGAQTLPLRGIPWFDNDVVNFLATLFGALVAIGTHLITDYVKRKQA